MLVAPLLEAQDRRCHVIRNSQTSRYPFKTITLLDQSPLDNVLAGSSIRSSGALDHIMHSDAVYHHFDNTNCTSTDESALCQLDQKSTAQFQAEHLNILGYSTKKCHLSIIWRRLLDEIS